MRLITNPNIHWSSLPAKVTLQTGDYYTIHDLSSADVEAISLLGSSLANCSIEYSLDNAVWVEVVASLSVTETGVVSGFAKVQGAKHWRVKNLGAVGFVKLFFVGAMRDIKSPVYPSQIVKDFFSTDKRTLGGVSYSKVHYSSYLGNLTLNFTDVEEKGFREMFTASKGFRLPFILEHKSAEVYVFTYTGGYPLQKLGNNVWKGAMEVREVL